LRARP